MMRNNRNVYLQRKEDMHSDMRTRQKKRKKNRKRIVEK